MVRGTVEETLNAMLDAEARLQHFPVCFGRCARASNRFWLIYFEATDFYFLA
jgi:hypothetical protein